MSNHPHLANLEQVVTNWAKYSQIECEHPEGKCECEQKNEECARQVVEMLHRHYDTLLNPRRDGFKEGADATSMERLINWIADKVCNNGCDRNELKQNLTTGWMVYQTSVMTESHRKRMHDMLQRNTVPSLPLDLEMQYTTIADDEIDLENSEEEEDEGDEGDDEEMRDFIDDEAVG
jgi:hypothetical protein